MGTGLELLPAMGIGSLMGAGIGGLTGGGRGAGIGAGLGLLGGGLGGYLSGLGGATVGSSGAIGPLLENGAFLSTEGGLGTLTGPLTQGGAFLSSNIPATSSGLSLNSILGGQGIGGALARGAVQGAGSAAIQGALAPPPPPAAVSAPSGPVPMMRPVQVPGQTIPTVNTAPRATVGAPMVGGISRLDPRLVDLLYRQGMA